MLRNLAEQRAAVAATQQKEIERRWNLQGIQPNSFTGANVTPTSAMAVPAVMAAITVLTEDVSSLPWFVYKRTKRGREVASDFYLFPILHDAVNEEITSMQWRDMTEGHILGWGNAYSQIIRTKGGQVAELWPLRPDRMRVYRDTPDGPRKYLYTQANGEPRAFLQQDILHIPGWNFDGLMGQSRIEAARNAIAILMSTEQFTGSFFANDARPGIALQYPKKLSDKALENIQKTWNLTHKGAGKNSNVAILEEGVTIQTIGLPNQDSEFIQIKQWGLEEVCRIFRVPPHKIQHLVRATLNNIEELGIEYVTDSLRTHLVRIETAVQLQLMSKAERTMFYNEILVDGLMRGNLASRYQAYAVGRQWGWLSANDVREKENMNDIDGGDQYMMPLNMVPVGSSQDTDGEPLDSTQGNRSKEVPATHVAGMAGGDRKSPQHSDVDLMSPRHTVDAFGDEIRMKRAKTSVALRRRLMASERPVIKDTAARVVRREIHDVKDAFKNLVNKSANSESLQKDFDGWLNTYYQGHQEFVQKQFAPVINHYGQVVADAAGDEVGYSQTTNNTNDTKKRGDEVPTGWTDDIQQFVQQYLASYAARHVGISQAEMKQMVQDALTESVQSGEDPITCLENELDGWEETRSDEIAQAESVRENNAVAKAVYTVAGLTSLIWIANSTACNYCSSLNGTVVSITSNFLNAGQEYKPEGADRPLTPSGNVGHPPAHGGCECLCAGWK